MTMQTGETRQIAALYESMDGAASVDELCEMFPHLAKEAIEIALMQGSALYRNRVKSKKELFSETALDTAQQVLENLMVGAEQEQV